MDELTRPIVGIESRTAQEVFDIMCARLTALSGDKDLIEHFTGRMLASKDAEIAALREQVKGLREALEPFARRLSGRSTWRDGR